MVDDICRDIKKLDYAKKCVFPCCSCANSRPCLLVPCLPAPARHLTNTITALKNVHMLVSIVNSLDESLREHKYRCDCGLGLVASLVLMASCCDRLHSAGILPTSSRPFQDCLRCSRPTR